MVQKSPHSRFCTRWPQSSPGLTTVSSFFGPKHVASTALLQGSRSRRGSEGKERQVKSGERRAAGLPGPGQDRTGPPGAGR